MAPRAERKDGIQYRKREAAPQHLEKKETRMPHRGSLHCVSGGSMSMHARVAASTSVMTLMPSGAQVSEVIFNFFWDNQQPRSRAPLLPGYRG
jgi:hypothetical protein